VKLEAGATGVTEDAADAGLVPYAFVAVTEQVYAVPYVSPETVIGLADPVPVIPPGTHAAVYVVIADPPVAPGAVNAILAEPFPAAALPIAGAAGGVA